MKNMMWGLLALGFVGFSHAADTGLSTSGNVGAPISMEGLPVNVPGALGMTQNLDLNTIVSGNSVSCNAGGLHTDNSYIRRFDLDGAEGIVFPIRVQRVNYAVEVASSGSGSQPVNVNIYSIPNNSPLTFGNLTLVASAASQVSDASSVWESVDIVGIVDPSVSDLVVEIFTPDGINDGNRFFVGSNSGGETAPTYLAAADCGVPEPTSVANVGFPDMHMLMSVEYQPLEVLNSKSVPSISVWGLGILASLLGLQGFGAFRRKN